MRLDVAKLPLQDRFQHLFNVISGQRFLNKQGLGNEVPFFICPYRPEEAVHMSRLQRQLCNRLGQQGIHVLDVDLYDLSVELLKQRGIWEQILEMEPTVAKDELKELLQGVLDPEHHLVPTIASRMATEAHRQMKQIVKQQEPEAFANWKALANDDWQPTYDMSGKTKRVVKFVLMAEQGYICCYCERRLTGEDSHIEHFRPQSDPSVDPIDFGNLLCSCQNQNKKGEPRHCGNLKEDWFDRCLIVSPLDPECENRFAFTGNGEIKSLADHDLAATVTIKKLGLDIAKLNALRANAIEPFLDDLLSHQEMQAFVTGYLNRDESGQFGELWTTIRNLFGGYILA